MRHEGALHLFAVGLRNTSTEATFTVSGGTGDGRVEVVGEDRELTLVDGTFVDSFEPYEVHVYRIASER